MFSEPWFWFLITGKVLNSLCPYTIEGIGPIISILNMLARIVFFVLVFFFAYEWWYGLVAIVANFIVPFFLPRIDPNNLSETGQAFSVGGSAISVVMTIMSYVMLFE